MAEQPNQPIYLDDQGVSRFRKNAIVEYLLDAGPVDLNQITLLPFSDEDRRQFAQLIGYPVSDYNNLLYVNYELAQMVSDAAKEYKK